MYNVTPSFVERLKSEGYDIWTISLWENWLSRMSDFKAIVKNIKIAFEDVMLGDGIGLLEANGLDDYADESRLVELRTLDERRRWQDISSDQLNQHYCSFGYCDAKGGLFLLPAYLLCELRDEYNFDFVGELIRGMNRKRAPLPPYLEALTSQQASVLCKLFELLKYHPEFYSLQDCIDIAIETIQSKVRSSSAE